MPNFDSQTIQLAVVAVVALAVLLQAIVLLAIFLALRKAIRSLHEDVEDLRSAVMPIIDNTRELFIHVAPRLEAAAADLAAMTHGLRVQTADVQSAAAEAIERMRAQVSRLDAMISGAFDAVDRASTFVSEAVAKPLRQLSGILASAKAVVESLRNAATAEPRPQPARPPAGHPLGEKDVFD
jgi:phage-related protein